MGTGQHNNQYQKDTALSPRQRRHHLSGKPSNNRNTVENFPRRFWVRVDRRGATECWPWIGTIDERNRGKVHLRWEGKNSVRKYAPVVAWELTKGAIPAGQVVCHRCDNPNCCNPSHLFLGTQAQNVLDCIQKGRRNAFGRQTLTEAQVLEIRALAATGMLQRAIAEQFQIARHTVSGIVNGKSWRHLPPFNEPIGQGQPSQAQTRLSASDVLNQVFQSVRGEVR